MINSVNIAETTQNPFIDVSKRTSDSIYWIKKESEIKILEKMYNSLPEILSPQEARKTNNIKTIGISIASVTLLAAATIFYIMRGGPKGFSKNIKAFRKNLENRLQTSKLNLEDNTIYNKFLQLSLKVTDKLQRKFEVANNFTTIKDLSFENFMKNKYTGKITGKIHTSITKLFTKIARRAVKGKYQETFEKLQNISALSKKALDKNSLQNPDEIVTIKGVKKTKQDWIKQLSKMESELFTEFEQSFGQNAQILRYKKFGKALLNLKEQFNTNGPLWFLSKKTLKNFVADSMVIGTRLDIQKQVQNLRKAFSYTLKDVSKEADDIIIEMSKSLNTSNTEGLKNLRTLNQYFHNLAKCTESGEKEKLIKTIEEQITEFATKAITSNKISTESGDQLYIYAQKLSNLLKNYKSGKIEDLLEIYQKIIPPKDYTAIETAYRGNIYALDRSIRLETEDCYNKLRDLTLGSAPTDVFTITTGIATLGYYLLQSESGKERTEITLKYGIPAITGIATVLYANAKLLAGSKSLTLSLISMFITNRLGDIANKLLESYYNKREISSQNS